MKDPLKILTALKRPKMLIRAARFGQDAYCRNRDLTRLLKSPSLPTPERSLPALLEQEAHLEKTRKLGDAGYSISHHIDVLIALMAEARLLPRSTKNA